MQKVVQPHIPLTPELIEVLRLEVRVLEGVYGGALRYRSGRAVGGGTIV